MPRLVKLENLIKRKTMNKTVLARMIGKSPSYLNQIIAGDIRMSASVLMTLSAALECRPEEIYEIEDAK